MKFGVNRCVNQVHKGRNTSNTIPGSKGNDARIANPAMAPELYAIKCSQLNEFKYLKSLRSRSNFRLEQIAANSSGKSVAKSITISRLFTTLLFRLNR